MNILLLSDIHSNTYTLLTRLPKIVSENDINLCLISGDLTNFAPIRAFQKTMNLVCQILEDRPIVWVPGNCDPRESLEIEKIECAINAHGRIVKVEEFKIFGIGGSLKGPFETNIEFTEEEFNKIISENLTEDFDILLLHEPPYMTKVDTVYDKHVGSKTIRALIEEKKPKLVACGHIHESKGIDYIGESIIINPGPFKLGHYVIVSLMDAEVKVVKNV
ncbi:YfcE family phosphodiesterase [archaeon]|nr:MAG: YfcE family phosphodiesterase [archaeon]RLG64461.1 MAG: YfcE family phosphodiesterase [archaeon]RLG65933.1 MAG: YfcE family phosphodiesterase [archaeon]